MLESLAVVVGTTSAICAEGAAEDDIDAMSVAVDMSDELADVGMLENVTDEVDAAEEELMALFDKVVEVVDESDESGTTASMANEDGVKTSITLCAPPEALLLGVAHGAVEEGVMEDTVDVAAEEAESVASASSELSVTSSC